MSLGATPEKAEYLDNLVSIHRKLAIIHYSLLITPYVKEKLFSFPLYKNYFGFLLLRKQFLINRS